MKEETSFVVFRGFNLLQNPSFSPASPQPGPSGERRVSGCVHREDTFPVKLEDYSSSDESSYEEKPVDTRGSAESRNRSRSRGGDEPSPKRRRMSPPSSRSPSPVILRRDQETQVDEIDIWSERPGLGEFIDSLGLPGRAASMDSDRTVLLDNIDDMLEPTLILDYESVRLKARLRKPRELAVVLETLQALIDQGVGVILS